jgi:hypothetical protein
MPESLPGATSVRPARLSETELRRMFLAAHRLAEDLDRVARGDNQWISEALLHDFQTEFTPTRTLALIAEIRMSRSLLWP